MHTVEPRLLDGADPMLCLLRLISTEVMRLVAAGDAEHAFDASIGACEKACIPFVCPPDANLGPVTLVRRTDRDPGQPSTGKSQSARESRQGI